MDKTRISLFYLGSYLVIIGIGLLLAPHQTLKIRIPPARAVWRKGGERR